MNNCKSETITLITFQHKDILNTLVNKGKYLCTRVSNYHAVTPISYQYLTDKLNEKSGVYAQNPIFAWADVLNRPLDVKSDTIDRALQATPLSLSSYYLFVLEVPKSQCLLTNFYNFVDMRFEEEEEGTLSNLEDYYVTYIDDADMVQAVIPHIQNEWVKAVYEIETKRDLVTSRYMPKHMIYNTYHNVLTDTYSNISLADNENILELDIPTQMTNHDLYKRFAYLFMSIDKALKEYGTESVTIKVGNFYYKVDMDISVHDFVTMILDTHPYDNKLDLNTI